MNDDLLYVYAPYAAAALVIVAVAWQATFGDGGGTEATPSLLRPSPVPPWTVGAAALVIVAAAHVAALVSPEAVLRWNESTARLVTLEVVGWIASVLCVGWLRMLLVRRAAAPGEGMTVADALCAALILAEAVTGLLGSAIYRWASSWSAVTIAPYIRSLATLDPRVELVASTPFLVRFHIVCGFAVLATAPFTTVGRRAAARIAVAARLAADVCAPIWYAMLNNALQRAAVIADALSMQTEEES